MNVLFYTFINPEKCKETLQKTFTQQSPNNENPESTTQVVLAKTVQELTTSPSSLNPFSQIGNAFTSFLQGKFIQNEIHYLKSSSEKLALLTKEELLKALTEKGFSWREIRYKDMYPFYCYQGRYLSNQFITDLLRNPIKKVSFEEELSVDLSKTKIQGTKEIAQETHYHIEAFEDQEKNIVENDPFLHLIERISLPEGKAEPLYITAQLLLSQKAMTPLSLLNHSFLKALCLVKGLKVPEKEPIALLQEKGHKIYGLKNHQAKATLAFPSEKTKNLLQVAYEWRGDIQQQEALSEEGSFPLDPLLKQVGTYEWKVQIYAHPKTGQWQEIRVGALNFHLFKALA